MGRLSERLGSISVVGLDTAIFIYHFEKHPRYFPLTQEIFSGIEAGLRKESLNDYADGDHRQALGFGTARCRP